MGRFANGLVMGGVVGFVVGAVALAEIRERQEGLYPEYYYPTFAEAGKGERPGATGWLPTNFPVDATNLLLRLHRDNNHVWAMFRPGGGPGGPLGLEDYCTTVSAEQFAVASHEPMGFRWWPKKWPEDLQYYGACKGEESTYFAYDAEGGVGWMYRGE